MTDQCEYCQAPETFGLLPALELKVPAWSTNMGAKGGGETTLIHPPKFPVSHFFGVRCKHDLNKKF